MSINRKGENFYKRVSVEYFGKLPEFIFTKVSNLSLGSPTGRRRFSSEEEEQPRTGKRTTRSDNNSPVCPEASRPRIQDISHDKAWDGF